MAWVRPDGRCFVRLDELDLEPDGEVFVDVAEDDVRALALCAEHGFQVNRRESVYRLSTGVAGGPVGAPEGFVFVRADEVDEARLRELDNELRQDVPGTGGWRWDAESFRSELRQPAFDPETYLVAENVSSGEYIGIVRVWINPEAPRLGFVGVRRDHRRRGLARALVAHVLAVLAARGQADVTTEIDDANVASRTLFSDFGARRCGGTVELVRCPRPEPDLEPEPTRG